MPEWQAVVTHHTVADTASERDYRWEAHTGGKDCRSKLKALNHNAHAKNGDSKRARAVEKRAAAGAVLQQSASDCCTHCEQPRPPMEAADEGKGPSHEHG